MKAKELKNGVHKHNLDCIKTIKEKYSEQLLKLRKNIDTQIADTSSRGFNNLYLDGELIEDMLKEHGVDDKDLQETGLDNWRRALEYLYAQDGFLIDLQRDQNFHSLNLVWNMPNGMPTLEEIAEIFNS